MVPPRGRMLSSASRLSVSSDSTSRRSGGVLDVLPGDAEQLVEHLLRIEPRPRQAERRIEAVGGVGLDHLADLADFQLRPEVGLLIDRPELVEHARRPVVAAIGRPGRIAPDGETHLAAAVAEAHAEIGLARLGLQLLLGGHQQEQVGLLAGRHFGERGDGHGAGHGRGLGIRVRDWQLTAQRFAKSITPRTASGRIAASPPRPLRRNCSIDCSGSVPILEEWLGRAGASAGKSAGDCRSLLIRNRRRYAHRPAADCSALSRRKPAVMATDLARGLRGLCGRRVPPGREHRGGLPPRPRAVLRLARRAEHSRAVDPRPGRLRRLAARPEAGPGQHRPAHRVAEGLLPLLAVGRGDARTTWPNCWEARNSGSGCRRCSAPSRSTGCSPRPAGPIRAGGATGRCWNCSTPPAAGRRSFRNLRLCDMHLDEGFCICRGKGDKERLVPLGGRAVEAVRAYLEHERPKLAARSPPAGRLGAAVAIAGGGCGGSGFGSC